MSVERSAVDASIAACSRTAADLLPPRLGVAACLLGLALLYLNLIPLEFSGLPVDEWLHRVAAMPWLDISLRGRADWVANLFMFVPFGFVLAGALGRTAHRLAGRVLVGGISAVIVVAWAYGIEALQVLVPQRTVSLNDWLAASLGGALGIGAWVIAGARLGRLAHDALQPSQHTLLAGLALYGLGYVVLSPFPYDFVLGAEEFAHKLQFGKYGAWMALSCAPVSRCVGQLAVESLVVIPVGMALVVWRRWPPTASTVVAAAAVGALFGMLIELAQFLTLSGISQGVSLLTRALGFAVGGLLAGVLCALAPADLQRLVRPWAVVAWLPYVGVVWLMTGLAAATWGGLASAAGQFETLRFAPFYYHYFTAEQAAMASLLYTVALYMPVGMLVWPWQQGGVRLGRRAALLAAMLALVVEGGKLFAVGLRPDPSNIFIAAFAGWAGLWILDWLASAPHGGRPGAEPPEFIPRRHPEDRNATVARVVEGSARTHDARPPPRRSYGAIFVGVVFAGVALLAASTHPLSSVVALSCVVLVLVVVIKWPVSWLILVPATLPVLDLRPWTGRLYVDEWDILVLAVLAALFLRRGAGGGAIGTRGRLLPSGRVWMSLYVLSYAAAVLFALWPLTWPEPFAFTTLHSPYNALRLAKGVAWALLLWPFFDAVTDSRTAAFGRFSLGMIVGLAAALASVLWERLAFPGLLDFSQVYRVTGFFSDTHTGGAFLEGYLVAAVPFLAAVFHWRRRWLWWPLAGLLFFLSVYAVAVTFARAGYVGLSIAVLVIVVALIWRFGAGIKVRVMALAVVLAVVGVGAALLLHIQDETFMSQRVDGETISRDWNTRVAHWRGTLGPVLRDTRATWLGMGVGRFPEVNYWEQLSAGEPVPAVHWLGPDEHGSVVLRLAPGRMTYYWQGVTIEPDTDYLVRVSVRSLGEQAGVGVMLCEQWLIYSRRCVWRTLRVASGEHDQLLEAHLRSPAPLGGFRLAQRPVKFAIYHAGGRDALAIDEISLVGPDAQALLANGDFANGLERWFFASDDHLAWHVKHMWGQVFFEQGVIGLMMWTMLLLAALWAAGRKLSLGGAQAWPNAVVLASLLAFLAVGLFDSLLDAPRLATLFFLLLLLALSDSRRVDWTSVPIPPHMRV